MAKKYTRGLFWLVVKVEDKIVSFMHYRQSIFQEQPFEWFVSSITKSYERTHGDNFQLISVNFVDHKESISIGDMISYHVKRHGVWAPEIHKSPINFRLCDLDELPILPAIGDDTRVGEKIDKILREAEKRLKDLYDIFFLPSKGGYEEIVCLGWAPHNMEVDIEGLPKSE